MYPWNNEEDGLYVISHNPESPEWYRIITWTANRNPTNNLRFIKPFGLQIEPDKIRYLGTFDIFADPDADDRDEPLFYIAWQGWHSNIRLQFYVRQRLYRLWIGWKIYPSSIVKGVPGYQKYGASFGHQFKCIKKL